MALSMLHLYYKQPTWFMLLICDTCTALCLPVFLNWDVAGTVDCKYGIPNYILGWRILALVTGTKE